MRHSLRRVSRITWTADGKQRKCALSCEELTLILLL